MHCDAERAAGRLQARCWNSGQARQCSSVNLLKQTAMILLGEVPSIAFLMQAFCPWIVAAGLFVFLCFIVHCNGQPIVCQPKELTKAQNAELRYRVALDRGVVPVSLGDDEQPELVADGDPLRLTPKGQRLKLKMLRGEISEYESDLMDAMNQLLIIIGCNYANTLGDTYEMLRSDVERGEAAVIHYQMLPVLSMLCAFAIKRGFVMVGTEEQDEEDVPAGPGEE